MDKEGDILSIKKMIEWSPRFFSILLILLLLMFSFDVFESNSPWYEILLGIMIHNIPVIVLLIVLWMSWQKPLIGSIVYTSVGFLYIVWMFFNEGISAWLAMLSLGIPAIIIGILYYIHYKLL